MTASLLLLVSSFVQGQVGIDAGTGILSGFGAPKSFTNVHIGVEVPRGTDQSVYGRLSYFLPVKRQQHEHYALQFDRQLQPFNELHLV